MNTTAFRTGILCSLFVVAGCQSQHVAGVTVADTDHTVEAIATAYERALTDGRFATHLRPHVHPESVDMLAENPLIRDLDESPAVSSPATHELTEISDTDREKAATWFDFPVAPTHVLTFTSEIEQGDSTMTVQSPLYLVEDNSAWYVAVGQLKSQAQINQSYEDERLTFSVDSGLWQHHWDLQFDVDSSAAYEIHLEQVGTDETLEVLLSRDDVKFAEGRKKIRFHLMPQGAQQVFEKHDNGTVTLPFAWQAGSRASSSAVTIEATKISDYQPNKHPDFSGDSIVLARLTAKTSAGPVEYVIALHRQTAE